MRLQEIIDTAGRFVAKLTNRRPERGGGRKAQDDLQRFNAGDQGFIDRDTDAYGWQPVNASNNATRPYPYPDDVLDEVVAEVIIDSRAYRAYSSGAAAGGDHSHWVDVYHPFHSHDVDIDTTSGLHGLVQNVNPRFGDVVSEQEAVGTSWTDLNAGLSSSDATDPMVFGLHVHLPSANVAQSVRFRLHNEANNEYYPTSDGTEAFVAPSDSGDVTILLIDPKGLPDTGGFLTVQAETAASIDIIYTWFYQSLGNHFHDVSAVETSTSELGTTQSESSDASGDHTHPVSPGLQEFATETASNVDLIVNGTTVATDINSGTFSETVDIAGHLTPGSNTIELSSDTLGLVNLNVNTQLFRSGREVL